MVADSQPSIDPDGIASHTFNRARRGFEADEVRAYLVKVAGQIRDLLRRHDDLGRRVVELERQTADPRELDEETVTELLGEQAAKLLVDARRTAQEMREQAEQEAASIRLEASETADRTRNEADQYAENIRGLADEADEKIRSDAKADAERIRERAEQETTEQRSAADDYEQRTRENVTAELDALRAKIENETTEMRRQAETVLTERTAEAEEASTRIRADADAYATAVREDADAAVSAIRADADTYAADTRAAADAHRDATAAQAEADRERIVEQAKEEGRAMVQEARDYRERVIADLGERRRAARHEMERMATTRDALAVALTDARIQIERAHALLQQAEIDPAEVGDLSVDRRRLIAPDDDGADTEAEGVGDLDAADPDPHVADTELEDGSSESDEMTDDGAETEEDGAAVDLGPTPDFEPEPEPEAEADGDAPASGDGEDGLPEETGREDEGAEHGDELEEEGDEDPDGGLSDAEGLADGRTPEPIGDVADPDDDLDAADPMAVDSGPEPIGAVEPGAGHESDEVDGADDGDPDPGTTGDHGEHDGGDDDEDDDGRNEHREPAGPDRAEFDDVAGPVDSPVEADESEPDGEADDPTAEPTPEPTGSDDSGAEEHGGVAPGIDDLFARIRAEQEASDGDDDPDDGDPGDDPDRSEPASAGEGEDDEPEPDADALRSDAADPTRDGRSVELDADDRDLLELRDATTDAVERQLARRLKRELADEQNELLDLLRRSGADPVRGEVLPGPDEHLARYRVAVLEDLRAAERSGAGFYGDPPEATADVDDIADEFARDLVHQFRSRMERAFDEGGGADDIAEAVRTLYREWKTQRIADVARHFVVTAFSRGVVGAASPGSSFRWIVDHGGDPAPDCEDNALAGAVVRGEPFPTGESNPPTHAGCRCLLVPVEPSTGP